MARARKRPDDTEPAPDEPVQVAEARTLDLTAVESVTGYLVRRAQLRFFDEAIKVLAPFGLRPALFSALVLIDANPGRSQTELAAALGIQRPNYVTMLDELEARGLAQRLPSATDRRSYAVVPTEEGRKLMRRAFKAVRAHEERMLEGFDAAERATLVALLRRI